MSEDMYEYTGRELITWPQEPVTGVTRMLGSAGATESPASVV